MAGLLDGGILGGGGPLSDMSQSESGDSDGSNSYRKPLGVQDFDEFGASGLNQGESRVLATVFTPAGLARRYGFGSAQKPENQGYAYGKFKNSDGETIHGVLTLEWANATGRERAVVAEVDSQDILTPNRYDREQQRPLPEQTAKPKAVQDQQLRIKFTPTTDPDSVGPYEVDAGESETRIPATEYEVA